MEYTKIQSQKMIRNTAIIARFREMTGAKTAIIDKIAKEYKLSVPAIRRILVKAECIGENARG